MQPYTFPKYVRIRKQKEVAQVFKCGTFKRIGFISIKYLSTDNGYCRFCISVKKKVGSAPYRNRLKRLIREAIRLQRPMLEGKGSYDVCFFITRSPQLPVKLKYIQQKIKTLFIELSQSTDD